MRAPWRKRRRHIERDPILQALSLCVDAYLAIGCVLAVCLWITGYRWVYWTIWALLGLVIVTWGLMLLLEYYQQRVLKYYQEMRDYESEQAPPLAIQQLELRGDHYVLPPAGDQTVVLPDGLLIDRSEFTATPEEGIELNSTELIQRFGDDATEVFQYPLVDGVSSPETGAVDDVRTGGYAPGLGHRAGTDTNPAGESYQSTWKDGVGSDERWTGPRGRRDSGHGRDGVPHDGAGHRTDVHEGGEAPGDGGATVEYFYESALLDSSSLSLGAGDHASTEAGSSSTDDGQHSGDRPEHS